MKPLSYSKKTPLAIDCKKLFEWHSRPGALHRLTPPWAKVKQLSPDEGELKDGAKVSLSIKVGWRWQDWELEHEGYIENERFCDRQIKGPFKSWKHCHLFTEESENNCLLEDQIEYRLPFQLITSRFKKVLVEKNLDRLFKYRSEILHEDLEAQKLNFLNKRLKILITGSSGFIGGALKPLLTTKGHEVVELSHSAGEGKFHWEPLSGKIDVQAFDGVDAVVHLGGEPIIGSWTEEKKDAIYNSRVLGTELLAKTIAGLEKKPELLITASGVNFYGNKRSELLHEQSLQGESFLAKVCGDWEKASDSARQAGVRVVNLRIGAVLSPAGGLLKEILPLFKACLGGRLGTGLQWMSWIAMDDLLDVIHYCLVNETMVGAVNATAPNAYTNFQFKQTLAKTLNRPAWIPVPPKALHSIFGDMAEELMLSDLKVHPQKLLASGFRFRYPQLNEALRHLLGR